MPPPAKPIANIDAVLADPAHRHENAERGQFQALIGRVGQALGTRQIGVNVTVVPAGKKAWPRHYHYGNDEMFVVLEGTGVLHYGDDDHPFGPGDVIHIEANTEIPFQLENTGETELKYLGLSTLHLTDVMVYAHTGKIGVMGGGAALRGGELGNGKRFLKFLRGDATAEYWEGEPDA